MWFSKHKEAFEDLETRLSRLEDAFKRSELETADLHDRVKRMLGRVVKERARMESMSTANGDDSEAIATTVPENPHQNTTLSAHQKQIQQQILRRRMGAL